MNNSEIKEIALKQSAEDIGCQAHDFLSDKNVIVPFCLGKNARKYYKEPIICNFVSYGSNIVVATTKDVSDLVTEYIGKFEFYHCFETPNYRQSGTKRAVFCHMYLSDKYPFFR